MDKTILTMKVQKIKCPSLANIFLKQPIRSMSGTWNMGLSTKAKDNAKMYFGSFFTGSILLQ